MQLAFLLRFHWCHDLKLRVLNASSIKTLSSSKSADNTERFNQSRKECVTTISSWNNAQFVETFFESVRPNVSPEVTFFWLVVDEFHQEAVKELKQSLSSDIILVSLEDLRILNLNFHLMQYNIVEMNTFVKPFFLEWLIIEQGMTSMLYFDNDILVLDSLTFIFDKLQSYSFFLTPHILQPLPDDGRRTDDFNIAASGVFNFGFFGVSNSKKVNLFLFLRSTLCKNCTI